ncbi:helix-turn-helix domain-containing protein [Parablautia sp. Marseille-Q6255]|uniref:helix-turn-helix domain-containing protein n=1 Tax=Parablautia sp. Marseille-Q6255 TaxID=3039593 RepID=UPI0024BCD0C3|nr:helix-turn-helix domain-containing protein [Parablautia sp. Marseille-Q6255]
MNEFVNNVTDLLKSKKISKNKLLTDLHLSKNSFVDWNKRGTIPSASVVSAIAEYLGTTVSTLLGTPEDEDVLTTFSEKFAYQLTVNNTSISDLAQFLGVEDNTIAGWMSGLDSTYVNYYEQLSDYFNILPEYWVIPGAISPGLRLNIEEYLLVLLYRDYRDQNVLQEDLYGSLSHFFPGIVCGFETIDRKADSEWLSLIHKLPRDAQIEFRGEIKGYLKRYEQESVAAERLKQAK